MVERALAIVSAVTSSRSTPGALHLLDGLRRAVLAVTAEVLPTLPATEDPTADADGVKRHRGLAERLLGGTATPLKFETAFRQLWPTGSERWSDEANLVMDRLFFVVEDYVDDPGLRDPGTRDLDEAGLRRGVRRFLDESAAP